MALTHKQPVILFRVLNPKTFTPKVLFSPLLYRTSSDSSRILTTMAETTRIIQKAGQSVTVFTADQKLYRMELDIL